jgi:hypothetical protein
LVASNGELEKGGPVGYFESILTASSQLGGEIAEPLEPALAWQRRAD